MERRSWRCGSLCRLLSITVLPNAVVAVSSASVADAETPCPLISPESRALGVDIIDDPACGFAPDPSLGCITSHCRYCQAEPTLHSFQYYPCSSSPSTIVPTPTASPAQLPSAECVALVSPTETAAGLSAANDATCATDSMGCFSASCRLCRLSNDAVGLNAFRSCAKLQSASAPSISQPQGQQTCGMQVSASQAELGVAVVTDTTCVEGSPGCLGVCRYCKLPELTVTGLDFCPSAIATAVATAKPPTTTVPDDSQIPTSLTGASTASSLAPCSVTLPATQQDVGLDVVTDNSCANVSSNALFGCFNPSCRLCKRFDSDYTGDLPGCEAITSSSRGAAIPIVTSESATNATTIVEPTCSIPSPSGASELGLRGDRFELRFEHFRWIRVPQRRVPRVQGVRHDAHVLSALLRDRPSRRQRRAER